MKSLSFLFNNSLHHSKHNTNPQPRSKNNTNTPQNNNTINHQYNHHHNHQGNPHHTLNHLPRYKSKIKFNLNTKGVLDEPLDLIVLIIGGLVIFAILSLIIYQGKEDSNTKSTDLITKTTSMSNQLTNWKIDLENDKTLKAKTRLETQLKTIARTGLNPDNDPLQNQPNSIEEAKPGYKS